ncbi:unnamed protein product, partial [Laminaria digitata]
KQEAADIDRAIALSNDEASASLNQGGSGSGNGGGGGGDSGSSSGLTSPTTTTGVEAVAKLEEAASRPAPPPMETFSSPPPPPCEDGAAPPLAGLDGGSDGEGVAVDAGVAGGAVAAVPTGGMDVVEGQAAGAEESDGPTLPAMGIDVCRSALKEMEGAHFDADSAACVTTLAKIVDNVVHRKDDARTRQIRCANAAFDLKVGRITGGIAFLEGVGFVAKNEGGGPQSLLGGGGGGSVGAAGIAARALVLPPDREDMALLKDARVLLTQQAVTLGVPPGSMPQPPRAPARPSPAVSSHGVAFDPYKPFMTSTAPTPKGSQEQSQTEKRLQELLAKRADVVAGGLPERNIQ